MRYGLASYDFRRLAIDSVIQNVIIVRLGPDKYNTGLARTSALRENLEGQMFVRRTESAKHDCKSLFPVIKDRWLLKRHVMKLAYWPGENAAGGQINDLNWEWVRGVRRPLDIGELRITDAIGGHVNLRVIFFVSTQLAEVPLPIIWILRVFPKKSNAFTTADIQSFNARRAAVRLKFYAG